MSKTRIILIEDSEDDYILARDALENGLSTIDYTLEWLEDAPDPDVFLKEFDPDVILIDYKLMGGMNGIEFAKKVRARSPYVNMILLTGLSSEDYKEIEEQTEGIGIFDFLSKKDITPESLSRPVRYAFENSRERRRLRDQAALIEDVLQRTGIVMWTESVGGNGTEPQYYFSDSIEMLTGYAREEFESGGVSLIDLILEEDRERIHALSLSARGGEQILRYRIRRRDEKILWIEEKRDTALDSDRRKTVRIAGSLRDVSGEVEWESMKNLMARSLDQSTEAILITDANLERPGPTIIYVNEAICKMSGYSASELIGQSPRIFQGPKTNRKVLDRLKMRLKAGKLFRGMTTNYRKDGGEYILNWTISSILNEAGQVTHYISTQTDITQKVEREKKLKEQESFIREIGSMARVGGWRYEKESPTIYWTEQVYEIHGVEPGHSIDLNTALSFYTKEGREVLTTTLTACTERGTPYDLVLEVIDTKGRKKTCRIEGTPIWVNGEIVGAWGLIQDITEMHRQANELEKALNEANLANSAKNQFLMMMSHELRTPLNPILGFTDLLLEDETDTGKRECLDQIHESASHLIDLISEILDISSLEAGRMTLESKSFDVVEVLREAVNVFCPNADAKGLKLTMINEYGSDGNEALTCLGDPAKFRQIVFNLLNNAIKFTESGSVTVELKSPVIRGDTADIEVLFRDTGIGIEQEELNNIFRRFYQVNMTATRRYGGKGVGLFLCGEIAKLMGGSVTARSELDEGSVFTLSLPLKCIHSPTINALVDSSKRAELERVLIVEDDQLNGLIVSRLLESMGLSYELVVSGFEALNLLVEEEFRTILMDIQMPILDGIETTRKIRGGGYGNRNIRIIAVSADVLDSTKEEAIAAGMDGFLEKPFSLSKLKEFFKDR
tara:strand:+ start:3056 stop:5764 length:2709 start_codon:yes stop_codon:yes gene_type:complete